MGGKASPCQRGNRSASLQNKPASTSVNPEHSLQIHTHVPTDIHICITCTHKHEMGTHTQMYKDAYHGTHTHTRTPVTYGKQNLAFVHNHIHGQYHTAWSKHFSQPLVQPACEMWKRLWEPMGASFPGILGSYSIKKIALLVELAWASITWIHLSGQTGVWFSLLARACTSRLTYSDTYFMVRRPGSLSGELART